MDHPKPKKPKAPPQKYQLTDEYIRDRERPAKGSEIDFDKEVKGFAVRLTSAVEATFLFCYGSKLAGGSQRRMVIGKWTPASGKATTSVVKGMRALASQYRGQVIAGHDPYAEQRAAAEAEAAQREADRKERQRLAQSEAEALRLEQAELTVNQLCDRYLNDHCASLRPATKRSAELRINRYVRPAWGDRKAKDIGKPDVAELIRPIRAAGKKSEVVHALALVTGMFSFAVECDDLETITVNPALGLKKKLVTKADRPKPRERALVGKREFRAFYLVTQPGIHKGLKDRVNKAMHEDEAACLRFMLLTGCRPSEAAGLPWGEIDMHAKVWNKPDDVPGRSKSRRADVVPLVEEAMSILQARRGNGSGYVFPAQRSKGKKPLTAHRLGVALRGVQHRILRMGVKPWTAHDCRRTVATGLFEIDVDSYLVKRTLNHATKGVTDTTYVKHRFMRQRRAALTAWAAYLEQTIRGTRVETVDNVVQFAKAGAR